MDDEVKLLKAKLIGLVDEIKDPELLASLLDFASSHAQGMSLEAYRKAIQQGHDSFETEDSKAHEEVLKMFE